MDRTTVERARAVRGSQAVLRMALVGEAAGLRRGANILSGLITFGRVSEPNAVAAIREEVARLTRYAEEAEEFAASTHPEYSL